ncbi:hypothetical protein BWD42_04205 [Sphingobacterium sp. CZ-UAM]|uniref:ParB/RepB/Spo0J family partition protein n=1 Tax=Sphingobacterium sp. CZ-UAM TaxID=1933868 RepID=UPI000984D1FF|nr:ParB/RepB/Spo0J family partition protein [Sphingobacterium sp. CZ-UAM]OOG19158.1 hypothetical protein BWD42_04205 [Sphingobacterium sp. CZ-UAM]
MIKSKEKNTKPKYSDFGLDDVKRNKDKGSVGTYFCAFDGWDENFGAPGHNVSSGFSFCFSNFCICPDCVGKSFLPENESRWYVDDCFKCKKKDVTCYHDTGAGDIATICESCMQWAAEVLKIETNKKSYNMARRKITDPDGALKEAVSINQGDAVRILTGKRKNSTGLIKEIREDGTIFVDMDEVEDSVSSHTHMCKSKDVEVIADPRSSLKIGDTVKILRGSHKGEFGTITENYIPGMTQIEVETNGNKEKVSIFNNWMLPVSQLGIAIEELLREKPKDEHQGIKLLHIPLLQISEDPNQPRKTFDDKAVHELAESIKEQGVLQPILVRPDADGYMIVCGERRYRASIIAGLETIPATVRNLTDKEALEIQITENLQRKDVDPLEEAASFLIMAEKMGYQNADIASKIGKDEKFVIRRLKLNGLVDDLKDWMRKGVLPVGHAERLATLEAVIQQEWYRERTRWSDDVPRYKELVSWIEHNVQKKLANANFDLDAENIVEGIPACNKCTSNSAVYSLFGETEIAICSDRQCYTRKAEVTYNSLLEEALADPKVFFVNDAYSDNERVKSLRKDGHVVYDRYEMTLLEDKPLLPQLPNLNRNDYDSDEEFRENLDEANIEYEEDLQDYEHNLSLYNESLSKATKAFDLSSGKFVLVKSIRVKSKDSKIGDSRNSIAARDLIIDLENKKKRGLELDQEKIMKKILEHMSENVPDTDLSPEELKCISVDYLSKIGYGQTAESIKKKFGIDKFYSYSNGKEYLDSLDSVGSGEVAKMVRISLLSNHSQIEPKSINGAIVFHLAKSWCPDILKTIELEQEEAKIKREARIDAQIKELEKELAN